MNQHEELENELAALKPFQPSPELKRRIADSLANSDAARCSPRRSPGPLWLAAICGPLAACLAIYLLRSGGDRPAGIAEPIELATQPSTAAAFDPSLPSLWSYRQALGRSADEVDALLDRHAQDSPDTRPQRAGAQVSVFARSNSQLETMLGEL